MIRMSIKSAAMAAVAAVGIAGGLVALAPSALGEEPAQGSIATSWSSGQKPQSKLWFDQGTWWAALPKDDGVYLWRYGDGRFEAQKKPGVLKDTKSKCECDVLLKGDVLYLLAFCPGAPQSPLHAFKAANGEYAELAGYPVSLPHPADTATMTCDLDSAGRLWISYVDKGHQEVVVQWLAAKDPAAGFSKPFALSPAGPGNISATAAFKGHLGVVWSDQKAHKYLFRAHADDKAPDQWEPVEEAASGQNLANDHINLAADGLGNLWAVTKGQTGPKIPFAQITLRRRNVDGKWDQAIGVLAEGQNGSRPVVILDGDQPVAYVLYQDKNSKPASICLRKVSLATSKVGAEEKILATDYNLNNATDLKGTVSKATGLMVVAGADQPKDGPARFRLVPLGDDR